VSVTQGVTTGTSPGGGTAPHPRQVRPAGVMATAIRRPAVLEHPRAGRPAGWAPAGGEPVGGRHPGTAGPAGCSGAGEQHALSTAGGQQPVAARTCAAAAGLQSSVQRPTEGSMQQRAGRLVQPLHPVAAAAHSAPVQRSGRSEAALQRAGPAPGEDEVQRRVPGERGRALRMRRLRRQAVRTGSRALPLGKESPLSGWSARGPGFTRSPGEPRPHGRPRWARSSGPRRKRDRTAGNRPPPLRIAPPSPTPGQVPQRRDRRALGAAVPETGRRRWQAAAPAQSEAGESRTAGRRRSLAAPKESARASRVTLSRLRPAIPTDGHLRRSEQISGERDGGRDGEL
jgi:hypothetical protein